MGTLTFFARRCEAKKLNTLGKKTLNEWEAIEENRLVTVIFWGN